MATIALTAENFKETVSRDGITLIDWWAPWCGPCRAFAPIFEEASTKYPGVTFAKVNTEEQQALASSFDIQSIPTLMIFRDRVLLFAQPGALPGAALDDLIKQAQALDMKKVREEIEAREKQAVN